MEPYRFDFFQAVRVLERFALEQATETPRKPVGHSNVPSREVVRFRALPAHSFPAGAISRLEQPKSDDEDEQVPWSMVVAFFGLTGPQGVLPHHYTTMLIDRGRSKDYSMRDFFDLFNHRAISLFYRAWEKYRFFIAYERANSDPDHREDDFFTSSLYSLVGLGTQKQRNRLSIDDESLLYYGGLFANRTRNAVSLERMLEDYCEVPVRIEQFCGQWLYLSEQDQSRMPCSEYPQGLNNQLGVSLVIGERVWDVQGKFRIRLGPLEYRQFLSFLPTGPALQSICELARMYVDLDLDFDVQPVLKKEEVPWCQLGGGEENPAYLGWNTWIRNRELSADAADAIFSLDGRPTQARAPHRNR